MKNCEQGLENAAPRPKKVYVFSSLRLHFSTTQTNHKLVINFFSLSFFLSPFQTSKEKLKSMAVTMIRLKDSLLCPL